MKLRLAVVINVVLASVAWAQEVSPHQLVQQGNDQLRAGQYDDAIETFKQAAELLPESAEIAYDQGIAHYRKGNFETAKEQFITALKTRDPTLEAKAKFNLGNCAYAGALAKRENIQEAVTELQSAILHYKDTIESDPTDKEARINVEMAQLFMKDLLDKQKQQQQQQQNEQSENQQQNESSEKQDQQDQQQSGEQEQDRQDEGEQQQGEQQQDGQQPDEQQPQSGEKQEQQAQTAEQQQQDGQERKMSREEAMRLLQLIRDKEMQRRRELSRRTRARFAPVDKDW